MQAMKMESMPISSGSRGGNAAAGRTGFTGAQKQRVAFMALTAALACFCLGYVGGPMLASTGSDSSTLSATSLSSTTRNIRGDPAAAESATATTTKTAPSISVTNDYTKVTPLSGYPWKYNAEPYRTTYLEVDIDGASEEGESTYAWYVDDHLQGYGSSVEVMFTETGAHEVVLQSLLPSGATSTYTFEVVVKYVRREIRALTDRDREAFFNAMSVLQRVPTEVGKQLYGDNYRSKDHFNRLHLYYGGTQDCDHWHQGAGFVTSHVLFTLQYEQALQAVNPVVTVPVWDFTLESTFYDAGSWRSSPVFASDWFGSASPDNELKTVTEGRWAYVPAMVNAQNFSSVYNSYGVLRAPWNNDPTPFFTRSEEVYGYVNNIKPSGCAEYHRSLSKDNWMAMSKQLNSAAHGHLHELMGGSWNHYYSNYEGQAMHPAVMTFAHEIQALSKELWRTDYVQCADSCNMSTPWQSCQCACTESTINDLEPYKVLDESGILSSVEFFDAEGHIINTWYDEDGVEYYTLPNYSEEESQKIYSSLLYLLCSPGHIGSMFQATSTNDVTFWVLHPSLDRLWHWKRLGQDSSFDETWDPYHTCYGHNPSDLQPFRNMLGDDSDSFMSNAVIYDKLHPENIDLPYRYADFEWKHCTALGYDMSN